MTTSLPAYSQRQLMACFAYLAYSGKLLTTPQPDAQILALMQQAIPQLKPIAQWQIVWGPAVYTTPGSRYQDNLLYLAQNSTDKTQFALAVRGTNLISHLNLEVEDLDVKELMPWPPVGSTAPAVPGALISESTSLALQILLALRSALPGGLHAPITALEFLRTQSTQPLNLCVTGHSLGGCLSGTLALYLKENASSWDLSGRSLVSCVTFAGPTAGNQAFAAHSDAQFRGGPYPPNWDEGLGTTFDAVRCSLDPAPLVWTATQLADREEATGTVRSRFFSLYAPALDFTQMKAPYGANWTNFFVPEVLPALASEYAPFGYAQPEATAVPLVGTINPDYVSAGADFATTYECFLKQAVYQHHKSYPILLGLPELNDQSIVQEQLAATPPTPAATASKQMKFKLLDLLVQHGGPLPA